MAVLVDLQGISVRLTDRDLLHDVSVTVSTGDRIGVVGINGTGKSTLLRVMAGHLSPDNGVVLRGRGTRIGMLDQQPNLPDGTVAEAVGDAWEAAAALDRLGMADFRQVDVGTLSGGQAKRVALAGLLAQPWDLLILDEPTNHLDLDGVAWLEEWLAHWKGGLVLVSHDRYLLDRVTTRMVELDRGTAFVHDGGYGSYLEHRAEREDRAVAAETTRRNLARSELAWLRRGAKARSRKPQARVAAARRLLAERPAEAARTGDLELTTAMPRLGNTVLECTQVGVTFPDGNDVLNRVDLLLGPGDRVGLVGANGAGKSTLLDVLAGRVTPTSGTVTTGSTVVLGYYDQHGSTLDPHATVQDVVAGPHRTPGSLADQALMQRFWFTGALPFTTVAHLSGGERRRLQLLAVLASQPNVLLLDEPTNDLDLETLRVLEDFLDDWPGTLVVVSHDRAFLDRTIETVVAVDHDGVAPVAGGVQGWLDRLSSPPSPPPRAVTAAAAPAKPAPSDPSGRRDGSSVPLGRLLREADKEIARLERKRSTLHEQLVATSDHQELHKLGAELHQVQAELSEAEERWLQLAESAEG